MYLAGNPIAIPLALSDFNEDMFPLALVLDSDLIQIATVSLSHVNNGLYQGDWLPPTNGTFYFFIIVFEDALHTIKSSYEPSFREIIVYNNDIDRSLTYLLGNAGVNARDVVITKGSDGNPLSAIRYIYASKADALADQNPIAQINVQTTFDSGLPAVLTRTKEI